MPATFANIGIVQSFAFAILLGAFATALFSGVARSAFATLVVLFKVPMLLGGSISVALASTVIAHGAPGSIDSRSSADLRPATAVPNAARTAA